MAHDVPCGRLRRRRTVAVVVVRGKCARFAAAPGGVEHTVTRAGLPIASKTTSTMAQSRATAQRERELVGSLLSLYPNDGRGLWPRRRCLGRWGAGQRRRAAWRWRQRPIFVCHVRALSVYAAQGGLRCRCGCAWLVAPRRAGAGRRSRRRRRWRSAIFASCRRLRTAGRLLGANGQPVLRAAQAAAVGRRAHRPTRVAAAPLAARVRLMRIGRQQPVLFIPSSVLFQRSQLDARAALPHRAAELFPLAQCAALVVLACGTAVAQLRRCDGGGATTATPTGGGSVLGSPGLPRRSPASTEKLLKGASRRRSTANVQLTLGRAVQHDRVAACARLRWQLSPPSTPRGGRVTWAVIVPALTGLAISAVLVADNIAAKYAHAAAMLATAVHPALYGRRRRSCSSRWSVSTSGL